MRWLLVFSLVLLLSVLAWLLHSRRQLQQQLFSLECKRLQEQARSLRHRAGQLQPLVRDLYPQLKTQRSREQLFKRLS